MPSVYRYGFKQEQGQIRYLAVTEIEITQEQYDQFDWSRPNRLDAAQEDMIIFLFKTQEQAEIFGMGVEFEHWKERDFEEMYQREEEFKAASLESAIVPINRELENAT